MKNMFFMFLSVIKNEYVCLKLCVWCSYFHCCLCCLDSARRLFMKIAFNSSADLNDPTVTDQVLKEVRTWCESLILSRCIIIILTSVHCSWRQCWLWEESPMWRWAGLKHPKKKWSKDESKMVSLFLQPSIQSESRRNVVKSLSDVVNDEEHLKLWFLFLDPCWSRSLETVRGRTAIMSFIIFIMHVSYSYSTC